MIPDWKLERYRLDELGPEDRAVVHHALEADGALRARLAALEQSDREIRAAYPTLPARSRPLPAPTGGSPLPRFVPVLVAAGAAAALAVVLVAHPAPRDDDAVTLKGRAALKVYRLAGPQQAERLVDGSRVKPHDVVQVAFDLQGARHAVVASVDGDGHTTLHWPLDGNTQVPAGFKSLPSAFELDEAPGFERFFLVASDAPLSPQAVVEAAKAAGRERPLALRGQLAVRSLLLEKEAR